MESNSGEDVAKQQTKLGPTASAISTALESNIALQTELKSRIAQVRKLQLENRSRAAEVSKSLAARWNVEAYHISNQSPRPLPNINPKRKWTRHFFVDQSGSTPTINAQAASAESPGEHARGEEAKLHVAWSKEDISTLKNIVNETLQKFSGSGSKSELENEESHPIPWEDKSFFEEVASNLNTYPSRSADECHLALFTFADVNIVDAKFSKEESLFILREIAKSDEGDVDWYELTSKLNSKFYSEPQRRTPWQCFKLYRSTLKDSKTHPPWTAEEDELLLKYVAARGPQFVFGDTSIPDACLRLFPQRDPHTILQRLNSSLVNPNYVQDRWDIEEERKLALLMRAYSDSENKLPSADHFPHRAQARVAHKWMRSLDPTKTNMPFSKREDKILLAAVKELGTDGDTGSFVSIAKLFPNRTSEQLWSRWAELSDEKEVVSKLQSRLVGKNFGRKKQLLGSGGDGLLSTDDFVVQKKRKK